MRLVVGIAAAMTLTACGGGASESEPEPWTLDVRLLDAVPFAFVANDDDRQCFVNRPETAIIVEDADGSVIGKTMLGRARPGGDPALGKMTTPSNCLVSLTVDLTDKSDFYTLRLTAPSYLYLSEQEAEVTLSADEVVEGSYTWLV